MLYTAFTSAALLVLQMVCMASSAAVISLANIIPRDEPTANPTGLPTKEISFKIGNSDAAVLRWVFGAIEQIPSSVLESGDAATNEWLAVHGYKRKPAGGTRVAAVQGWWEVAECAGAIAAFIGGNLISASKLLKIKKYLEALGGLRKSAELLLVASTWEERLRVGGSALVGLVEEIMGVAGIQKYCT